MHVKLCCIFYNILFNFGSHNNGCKLPSSLPHEWLAEWKEQYITETQQKILLAQFLHTLPLKVRVKLCCIWPVSTVFNFGSHNDGCKLPSSLPHEWLAEWKEQYIIETQQKILLAQFLHTLPLKVRVKLCCIFYNILFDFGSHNDGCKLLSALPPEWLAEWKEQYIIETQQKIPLAQFLHTLPQKVRVKHDAFCKFLQYTAQLWQP